MLGLHVYVMKQHRENEQHGPLAAARRVVIKIGTNVVTGGTSEFSTAQVEPLARSMARLKREGRQVVVISSGAVGLGAGRLKLDRARLRDLATRQACAAVGQSLLMRAYEQLFGAQDVAIAQVLLTEDDFMDWRRHLNLRRTIEKLLKLGVLPIINENDTVSTVELEYAKSEGASRTFGDNDRLAALVMSKLDADALIILTNVDGLLHRTPNRDGKSASDGLPTPRECVDGWWSTLGRGRPSCKAKLVCSLPESCAWKTNSSHWMSSASLIATDASLRVAWRIAIALKPKN